MRILKICQNSFLRVWYYRSDYFVSIIFLQTIRGIIVLPILSFIFYRMLERAKIVSLTDKTFLTIFRHPWAIFFALLLLLLSVVFVFYELGYYFLLADQQAKNQPYTFMSLFKRLNQKAKYFLSIHSALLAGYLLLILPLVSIGLSPELTKNIKIPEFIVDDLLTTTAGQILYNGVILLFSYIAVRLVFSIYFFVTEKELPIFDGLKKSWQFSKGKIIQTLLVLGILSISYGLIMVLGIALFFLPLMLSEALFTPLSPVTAGITLTGVQILIFTVGGLIQPLIANGIAGLTDEKQEWQRDTTIQRFSLNLWFKKNRLIFRLLLIWMTILFLLNSWSAISLVYQPITQIIAHRGFMEKGVENTISSLKGAAEAKADIVEMDIQETKDKKFVVIHDFNLKKLAGINEEVRNLTLAELQEITVEQNGFSEKIPSLSEYIDVAKSKGIRLLIEVKPHGYESDEMVANLVKLLNKKRVVEKYLVQSLDITVLDAIKKEEPNLETGYVIPLNLGSLPETIHNFYVLEEFSINEKILNQASVMKKDLFAWTINREELMRKFLRQNIEGMITDHPDVAYELRESRENTKDFGSRVRFLLEDTESFILDD